MPQVFFWIHVILTKMILLHMDQTKTHLTWLMDQSELKVMWLKKILSKRDQKVSLVTWVRGSNYKLICNGNSTWKQNILKMETLLVYEATSLICVEIYSTLTSCNINNGIDVMSCGSKWMTEVWIKWWSLLEILHPQISLKSDMNGLIF